MPTNKENGDHRKSQKKTSQVMAQVAAIAAERSKGTMVFREALSPGLVFEMELKAMMASEQTPFQKVDVIETYFGKTLVTDGKTQSAQFDEFAYHESLVHPALLKASLSSVAADASSSSSKRVFVGGGGELATVREVLRHANVENVVMVDVDQTVVEFCRRYLPEWGGDVVASDPRLELIFGDAYAYLMNCQETFDVIIMDISDPIEAGPGAMLYTQEFYAHAKTLLNPQGVFVTQAGCADAVPAAAVEITDVDPSCFAPIYNTLKTVFNHVIPYALHIPSYGGGWGFVMAYNDDCNGNGNHLDWTNPTRGLVDDLIERHISGGRESLQWYDGTTHLSIFNLSKPLRKYIAMDGRIMTRDNPIFMY